MSYESTDQLNILPTFIHAITGMLLTQNPVPELLSLPTLILILQDSPQPLLKDDLTK